MAVRAFKVASLEDQWEDYGQAVRYLGTTHLMPHALVLDDRHEFAISGPVRVCWNTVAMLSEARLARHFAVRGDRSVHYGPFPYDPDAKAGGEGDRLDCGCC